MVPAVFGIESSGLDLAVRLALLFVVVLWLALVFWTFADARRRVADPILIGCATVASLFPFVGTLVYVIVRPPEYLADVRERDLEIQAAEARLAQIGHTVCPYCDGVVEKDFLRCPTCLRKLKDPCHNCHRPLEPQWTVCPYCEAEVPGAIAAPITQERAPRRRRRHAADQAMPTLADEVVQPTVEHEQL